MATVTFDTHAFVKRLKDSGFSEAQAEALSEAHTESFSEALNSTLATKSDIQLLEKVLKSDIQLLEKALKSDISRVEKELKGDIHRLEKELLVIKWMMGVMLAGVISLVMKTFFM